MRPPTMRGLRVGLQIAGKRERPLQLQLRHVGGRQAGRRRVLEPRVGRVLSPAVPARSRRRIECAPVPRRCTSPRRRASCTSGSRTSCRSGTRRWRGARRRCGRWPSSPSSRFPSPTARGRATSRGTLAVGRAVDAGVVALRAGALVELGAIGRLAWSERSRARERADRAECVWRDGRISDTW